MTAEQNRSRRPGEAWRRSNSLRAAELDPAGEPIGTVFSTVYVADELLIELGEAQDDALEYVAGLARSAGWGVDPTVPLTDGPEARPGVLAEDLGEGDANDEQRRLAELLERMPSVIRRVTALPPGEPRTVRVRLDVARGATTPAATPDAWQILRQARVDGKATGISLNHVISTDPFKANPFKANPFKANPFKANPFKANAAGVGIDSYAAVGFGGRQPVTFIGQAPKDADPKGPVVAVFDTGLGVHDWFPASAVVTSAPKLGIGRYDAGPEAHPWVAEPLEGLIDDTSGHGTFIAGIIRQRCHRARILPVWIADGEGLILESELIDALGKLMLYRAKPGTRVDVLNLSFSFYHETPDDPRTISEMKRMLEQLRNDGCVVVCSAGNEATDRPTLPAAVPGADGLHAAIGALNPAGTSVALFSNVGPWVDGYAPGVSVVSTLPYVFTGGVQAGTRDDLYGLRRETLDIDDFAGGFAVWSGTSFSAPYVAAAVAEQLADGADPATAVAKALEALKP